MHDPLPMGAVQRVEELQGDGHYVIGVQLPLFLDDLTQGRPPDQLHRQEEDGPLADVVLAEVVHRHDVGVLQLGTDRSLLAEALGEAVLGRGEVEGLEHLQGDLSPQGSLGGEVDHPHAPSDQ